MEGHSISQAALRRFLAGTATSAERQEVARHLLQGCAECRRFLRTSLPQAAPTGPFIDAAYDRAFDQACQAVLSRPDGAGAILHELLSHPEPRQELLARNHPRYWNAEVCDLLIARSRDLRFADPQGMLQCARLAVLAAQRIPREAEPEDTVVSCRTRAWMAFGNGLRVSGDLERAEQALRRAAGFYARSESPTALRADLLGNFASLRFDQRQFKQSIELAQQEIAIRRDLHRPLDVTGSLVQRAMSLGEGGQPDQALKVLREAERMLGVQSDPWMAAIVRHNIIRFHVVRGDAALALELFDDAQTLYRRAEDRQIQIKALWLQGQILSAAAPHDAVGPLTLTRDRLLEQGNTYEAALAGLDLAVVLARLGHRREVRRLAGTALREMRARRIERESLAALILLRRAS
jgi:tetratricopeptide (TPR) repeat protein